MIILFWCCMMSSLIDWLPDFSPVSGTNCERRHPRSAQLTFSMQLPAGEPSSSNSSVWSHIHARSPNLRGSTENGFVSAGFSSTSRPSTLCLRLRARLAICHECLRSWSRVVVDCILSPVPRRVYGISSEARFTGATAPPPRDPSIVPADRLTGGGGPVQDRFTGASAPARSGERASSNSDSPPYLPVQPRVGNQGFGANSGVRDMAV